MIRKFQTTARVPGNPQGHSYNTTIGAISRDSNNVVDGKLDLKNGRCHIAFSTCNTSGAVITNPSASVTNRGRLRPHEVLPCGFATENSVVPMYLANMEYGGDSTDRFPGLAEAHNRARANFYRGSGGLLVSSAALGVSLASWRQSRDMIVKRYKSVGDVVQKAAYNLETNPRRRAWLRRQRAVEDSPADLVLETKFGWGPLFEDLEAGTRVLYSPVPPKRESFYHTGRGKSVIVRVNVPAPSYQPSFCATRILSQAVRYGTTYGARVRVINERAYLLNKLGLINPAVVAWDLVPWSFVVNQIVNVNSFLSQVTDDVGFEITDEAVTDTVQSTIAWETVGSAGWIRYDTSHFAKRRTLNSRPKTTLQMRVPELNMGLLVTAGALVMQRIRKFNALLKVL